MSAQQLAHARSLLFVPGHRPERFDRALASGADAVIIDLEDAVAPQDKDTAREQIAHWLAAQPEAVRARVLLRLNAEDDTRAHAADLAWLPTQHAHAPAALVLPKAGDPRTLAAVAQAAHAGTPLLPLVESAAGWGAVDALAAAPQVLRLVFGHLDFQLDMGMDGSPDQHELLPVRLALVAASRRAGLAAPIDGVSPTLDDETQTRADTERARRLGFGGKLCIHPRQVALVNAGLSPSAEERDWARRVLAANAAHGGAAFQLDGRMVDAPVLRRAQRIQSSQPLEES